MHLHTSKQFVFHTKVPFLEKRQHQSNRNTITLVALGKWTV